MITAPILFSRCIAALKRRIRRRVDIALLGFLERKIAALLAVMDHKAKAEIKAIDARIAQLREALSKPNAAREIDALAVGHELAELVKRRRALTDNFSLC